MPAAKSSDSQPGWQPEREDGVSRDRTKLSSTQLYQLAARGKIQLSQAEKDRVSPDYLFVLAITKKNGLNQRDKDRLRPLHLAHLAVMEKIDLTQEDKRRLPTNSADSGNSNFKWTCD